MKKQTNPQKDLLCNFIIYACVECGYTVVAVNALEVIEPTIAIKCPNLCKRSGNRRVSYIYSTHTQIFDEKQKAFMRQYYEGKNMQFVDPENLLE